ncbi:hypothetical protein [Polaromonas sp. YR568]|uniref:hypothetical protein n=1 Tax=Polaromonas sp. YR568 TaxID=1855301 RepID=UPI00398BC51A
MSLVLPKTKGGAEIQGTLRVSGDAGTKFIEHKHLSNKQAIPLRLSFPLIDINGTGQMANLADELLSLVGQVRNGINLFHAIEDGGELLSSQEPLELGCNYVLIAPTKQPMPSDDSQIRLVNRASYEGWQMYEFQLPHGNSGSQLQLVNHASNYFRRQVRIESPRVFLVDTPHHYEWDGTAVFPEGDSAIRVRRTASIECDIYSHETQGVGPSITWLDDEFGEIRRNQELSIALFCGQREQLSIRTESCLLYAPEGVRVTVDAATLELFDEGLPAIVGKNYEIDVNIRFPSVRVMSFASYEKTAWNTDGLTISSRWREGVSSVRAGNFGLLSAPEVPFFQPRAVLPNHEQLWLSGIRSRHSSISVGSRIVAKERDVLDDGFSLNKNFRPHIQYLKKKDELK